MKIIKSKKHILYPAVFLMFCLVSLEWLCYIQWLNSYLVPPPSAILNAFFENQNQFLTALSSSFAAILTGIGLSLFFGFVLGVVFFYIPILKWSVYPIAVFFQTVPIIAIAPLLIIYFGYGFPTIVASSVIVTFFPIFVNTLLGLDSVPHEYLTLFKHYQATASQVFIYLRLPFLYPFLYASLKIALGLSIVGVVIGEFITGGGIGGMIDSARTQQRVDILFAGLSLLMMIGAFLLVVLNILHLYFRRFSPLFFRRNYES